MLLQFIAVFACTLFVGAAVYINCVEHPARLSCGTELAVTVFAPSYHRATVMQASLAIIAAAAALGVWWQSGEWLWLVGALFIFSVVPFTVFVIMPTNKKLLAISSGSATDKSAASTRKLLEAWGRLHAARSTASIIASLLFFWLVLHG